MIALPVGDSRIVSDASLSRLPALVAPLAVVASIKQLCPSSEISIQFLHILSI